MLEAVQLTRRYGEFVAVDDVTFQIAPGEVVGLLGHNGAGKTTVMKMLTGFLEPSSGAVRVDGADVATGTSRVQAQMGYLPESLPIYPELTVAEYLAFGARLRGVDPAAAVPRAVRATELAEKLNDPIATLSRGFKQRVGVAQAILHEPKFLILDEPTNGLDPSQTQAMRLLIKSLAERATVILSTHIMQEVKAICDRVLIMRAGALVVDERLDALTESSSLRVNAHLPDRSLEEVLRGVDGVSGVMETPEGWIVRVEGAVDRCASRVAGSMVRAGAELYELAPVQRDLEAVFRDVSEGQLAGART